MVIWKNLEYMQHKESRTKAKELERQGEGKEELD